MIWVERNTKVICKELFPKDIFVYQMLPSLEEIINQYLLTFFCSYKTFFIIF